MGFADLFRRPRKAEIGTTATSPVSPVQSAQALAQFIAGLGMREQPVLLDLGPVVASHVRFFGEELGCRLVIQDLSNDTEGHLGRAKLEELTAWFDRQFSQESETIDGILCWDTFDYLERDPGQGLARHLVRMLKPDGILHAFFGTADPRSTAQSACVRHVVIDPAHVECQPRKTHLAKQRPWPTRDLEPLFEPLRMTEMLLLDGHVREVLFRKPPAAVPDVVTAPPAGRRRAARK